MTTMDKIQTALTYAAAPLLLVPMGLMYLKNAFKTTTLGHYKTWGEWNK